MQSRNGGWGAFDVDNTRTFVTQIPFARLRRDARPAERGRDRARRRGAGADSEWPAMTPMLRRAVAYLWRHAGSATGRWFGRWGVNYVYGTRRGGARADRARRRPRRSGASAARSRGCDEHQNADGGWGETCASYDDPALRGRGAEHGVADGVGAARAARGRRHAPRRVARGVRYLVATQAADGAVGGGRSSPARASPATSC